MATRGKKEKDPRVLIEDIASWRTLLEEFEGLIVTEVYSATFGRCDAIVPTVNELFKQIDDVHDKVRYVTVDVASIVSSAREEQRIEAQKRADLDRVNERREGAGVGGGDDGADENADGENVVASTANLGALATSASTMNMAAAAANAGKKGKGGLFKMPLLEEFESYDHPRPQWQFIRLGKVEAMLSNPNPPKMRQIILNNLAGITVTDTNDDNDEDDEAKAEEAEEEAEAQEQEEEAVPEGPALLTFHVVSAADIPDRDTLGKQDPYVVIQVGDDGPTVQTKVQPNQGTTPTFDERLQVRLESAPSKNTAVHITIMDHDLGKEDDVVCRATLTWGALLDFDGPDLVTMEYEERDAGVLTLGVQVQYGVEEEAAAEEEEAAAEEEEAAAEEEEAAAEEEEAAAEEEEAAAEEEEAAAEEEAAEATEAPEATQEAAEDEPAEEAADEPEAAEATEAPKPDQEPDAAQTEE